MHSNLEVAANSILVISYVGYIPQEVEINTQVTLNIQPKEDVKLLDEGVARVNIVLQNIDML